MRIKQLTHALGAVCLVASLNWCGAAALAAPAGDSHDLHGRELKSFSTDERNLWQSGRWVHDWHDGHLAWWWTVGGFWYLYPQPAFPYPRYVATFAVTGNQPPAPEGLSSAQSWFYCDRPSGYTPYVSSCDGTWRQVAISPATVAQE